MPYFRKKPVITSAEQWFPGLSIEGVVQPHPGSTTKFEPYISTLEGDRLVSPGDWIITAINGEKYCRSNEIFKEYYDPIDDDGANSLGWQSLEEYERCKIIYLESDETLEFS